ncbi:MAG: helix-turn-helix domain-containing protein [Muribaculaceae bacterium]|nr:helix-turn-helix domain-containing protein [Muribaculaceae bacterium]
MKRLMLMALATLLAVAARSTDIESLYGTYVKSGMRDVQQANAIFQKLLDDEWADTLYHFASNANMKEVNATLSYYMADYYYNQAQYDNSLAAGRRALQCFDGWHDAMLEGDVYSIMSIASVRKGNLADAMDYTTRAYKLDVKLADEDRISSDLNTLGGIYLTAGMAEPGLKVAEEAIGIERRLGHNKHLTVRLGMSADLYLLLHDYEHALERLKEAYQIDRRDGRKRSEAIRLSQMAEAYIGQLDLKNARVALNMALPILQETGDAHSMAVVMRQKGEIDLIEWKLDDAVAAFEKGLELSRMTGSRVVERGCERGLWRALRGMDEHASLAHLERYCELNDSLSGIGAAQQLSQFQAKLHEQEMAELKQATRRHTLLLGAVAALCVLACASCLWWLWRQRRRAAKAVTAAAMSQAEEGTANGDDENGEETADAGGELPIMSRPDKQFLADFVKIVYRQMPQGNVDVETVAGMMGLSRRQLSYRIQTLTGENPSKYILHLRLARAHKLLTTTDEPVGEIAATCGFQDGPHFSRIFKSYYQITPSDCRRMGMAGPN